MKELLLEYNIYFRKKSMNELENTISNVEEEEILFIDNSFLDNKKDFFKKYSNLVDIIINDISKKVYISDTEILKSKSLNIL